MKKQLEQQFRTAHELEINDSYVNWFYTSPASDKLMEAYEDAMKKATVA
jgi:hypothetical protein